MQFNYDCLSSRLNYPLSSPSTPVMENKNHLLCEHNMSSIGKCSVDPGLINCKTSGDWFSKKRNIAESFEKGKFVHLYTIDIRKSIFLQKKKGMKVSLLISALSDFIEICKLSSILNFFKW